MVTNMILTLFFLNLCVSILLVVLQIWIILYLMKPDNPHYRFKQVRKLREKIRRAITTSKIEI